MWSIQLHPILLLINVCSKLFSTNKAKIVMSTLIRMSPKIRYSNPNQFQISFKITLLQKKKRNSFIKQQTNEEKKVCYWDWKLLKSWRQKEKFDDLLMICVNEWSFVWVLTELGLFNLLSAKIMDFSSFQILFKYFCVSFFGKCTADNTN